jgi:hypothetical protein
MRQFSEKELVDLNYAVMAINAWNRLAIAFRKQPRISRQTAAEPGTREEQGRMTG